MWVDDRQFSASGEELPSFVSRQGLSTCVSKHLTAPRVSIWSEIGDPLVLTFVFCGGSHCSVMVEETANSSSTCHGCSRTFQPVTLSGPGRKNSAADRANGTTSATNGNSDSNSANGTAGTAMDTGADGISPLGRYRCTDCLNDFCTECDVFIHDVLHCCPGCER